MCECKDIDKTNSTIPIQYEVNYYSKLKKKRYKSIKCIKYQKTIHTNKKETGKICELKIIIE